MLSVLISFLFAILLTVNVLTTLFLVMLTRGASLMYSSIVTRNEEGGCISVTHQHIDH